MPIPPPTANSVNSTEAQQRAPATSFPIVGVGASAGGLEAITELLSNLPGDTGIAFLIVQHLDPGHPSLLVEILAKKTSMPVSQAIEGETIEPNHVYTIPPNTSMTVSHQQLSLRPRPERLGPPMPIDDLFESLADNHGPNAIGVILSGTGSDGALGMQAIKGEGGLTFAQEQKSARFNSMPKAAIEIGSVDFVLAPAAIAEELLRLRRHVHRLSYEPAALIDVIADDDDDLGNIFRQVRDVCHIDFTLYKRATVKRRLGRRLALHKLETLAEYVRFLQATPGEAENLCQDLLIRVTSFFRNPETFDELVRTVLPRLLEDRSRERPLRIWVPGCASGEEVYSIAICVLEYLGERAAGIPIQLFGTDASNAAIETARAGLYIENIARNVSEERLRRFFVKQGAYYQVGKAVRDLCVFSHHDLTRDPPFSRMDLVSCRNLLIYLTPELQKRVFPIFHYALNPDGCLMLGLSETIGEFSEFFTLIDNKKLKIYLKKPTPGRAPLPRRPDYTIRRRSQDRTPAEAAAKPSEMEQIQRQADSLALSRYAPAGVLCDEELNILQFRGDTDPYLTHPPGPPSHNLQKLVRPELLVSIAGAIRAARKDGTPVRRAGLRIETPGGDRQVCLEVIPVQHATIAGCWFLIFFDEMPVRRRASVGYPTFWPSLGTFLFRRLLSRDGNRSHTEKDERIAQLTQELEAGRNYLRAVVEEHESANEELKSAQEELMSSNEEFQSTNEELETAKEELQSTNEELETTNDELRHRNRELSERNEEVRQARDYADAIVETVGVPLIVLDEGLRVLRANRAFYEYFKTTATATEHCLIYEVGNRQWAIPAMKKLLSESMEPDYLPEESEVTHVFPEIGQRTMRFKARRLGWAGHAFILLAIEDVTERKRAFDLLRDGDRRKDEFLAMLAHELRNPLGAMSNALELLERGDIGPDVEQRARAMIRRQIEQEVRLVDDLLDVSRITRGAIVLKKDRVDLVGLVVDVLAATRHVIEARGHRVTTVIPSEAILIDGDATRLEQVVANLLSNAAKYTEPGGSINLTLVREDRQAVLKVADNGIGIAPELLPEIFGLFVQAARSPDRSQGGLGLGLTLVQRLVELHDGTVEAVSRGLGTGSTFVVRLPVLPTTAALPSRAVDIPTSVAASPCRVLVVDDFDDTADSIATLLRLEGHEVEVAADGHAAILAATAFRPQVVLLDIGLPGLNGLQVAARLRQMPEVRDALLVAISGYGQAEDRQRSIDAGFSEHMVKPVNTRHLQALIASYQGRKSS